MLFEGRGEVVVTARYDAGEATACVEVADNGPGVSPGEEDKLFMPYYSTKRRGSGLGLAIVKRIVAEHRGRVRVVANEPRGARFIIDLPVDNPDAPSGAKRESRVTTNR